MSIETVLSWPTFADQSPNTYLKSLLATPPDDHAKPFRSEVIHQNVRSDQLLQRFLDNVFIYNPVIEETTLYQYIREIEFHGFGSDAKSCLLVSKRTLQMPSPNHSSYSFMPMDL